MEDYVRKPISRCGAWMGLLVVGLTAVWARAGAQGVSDGRRNVLSINPLGIPFEWFTLEFEHGTKGPMSFGLAGSYLGVSDGSYSSLDAKLRFYPNEEGPKGFSVGISAGVTRLTEDFGDTNSDEVRPTVGVVIDYNWLLGRNKRFFVGTGVGAKRVLGVNDNDFIDINFAYPTVRFQVGVRY